MSGILYATPTPARVTVTYPTIAADTDLVAAYAAALNASATNQAKVPGRPSIRIRATIAGNLTVQYGMNDTGAAITDIVPFLAGETQHLEATKLLAAGTTATGITVFW